MQVSKFFIVILFITGLIVTGYQCSSTELTSAKLYISQKNFDKALEALNQEVAKNPKSDEGYFLMGVVYGEKEDMKKMVESYDKSLSISNKFSKEISDQKGMYWQTYFNRGVNNYSKGTATQDKDSVKIYMDIAVENYNTAVMLAPDTADNYRNIAYAYLYSGEIEKAAEPLEKLLTLEKSEDGYQYLGEVYSTMGSNKMIEYKNSSNAQDSIEAIKLYNDAIAVLTTGKTLYPKNGQISATLTQSYIGAGKIDEALTEAEASVLADPQNKDYIYNYGVLLLSSERFAEAETQFKAALAIDPAFDNAIYNLGVTYVLWGTDINKKAEEQGVTNDEYKEKYRSSLPYLEKVVETDPENIQIWELLGKVYTMLGMNAEAENAFAKADALR